MNLQASLDIPDAPDGDPPADHFWLGRISRNFPQVEPAQISGLTRTQAISLYYSLLNGEKIMQDTIDNIAGMIAEDNKLIADLQENNKSRTGIAVALGALLGITIT